VTTTNERKRTVVITGAGSGIGLGIAERLAADGWLVVGIERLEANGERFRARVPEGLLVTGDIVDHAVLEEAARVAEDAGTLTAWVNNAGVAIPGTLHDPNPDEARQVFEINLIAAFWGSSVAVRSFLAHEVEGRILNVSSIHGTGSFPGYAAYDVTKGGMNALTRNTAVQYGVLGIRANAIAPGAIKTDMLANTIASSPDPEGRERELAHFHPLERLGDPREVAAVAAFLLSDEASFVNGQIVGVDGGANARSYRLEPADDIAELIARRAAG
jgi:glucose 1-dehydrogenase